MKLWTRLWHDRAGSITAVGMLLLYAILVFGAVTGLIALRDQIVQEFGDVAVAIDSLDQSWHADNMGTGYNDPGPTLTDPVNQAPAGLDLQQPSVAEGDPLPGP